MTPIPSSSKEFMGLIKTTLGSPSDLQFESLVAEKVVIAYISSMVNKTDLQTNIMATLSQLDVKKNKYTGEEVLPLISENGGMGRINIRDVTNDLILGKTAVHLVDNAVTW